MKRTKKIRKSSIDGRFVSKAYALANPETTFEEVVDLPEKREETKTEMTDAGYWQSGDEPCGVKG